MSTPYIEAFLIDDDNEDAFWEHGVVAQRVLEVLDGEYAVKVNRRGRTATHLVIGRDAQGQCIAIPICPTHDPVLWRPLTAWWCKPHEWGWLPRRGGG